MRHSEKVALYRGKENRKRLCPWRHPSQPAECGDKIMIAAELVKAQNAVALDFVRTTTVAYVILFPRVT